MTVYLVGAGPGDPGLLTLRAAEILGVADVVVHDRLADASLLELAPARARRIDVGKSPGGPVHQDEINALLVSEGRAGRTVVRLKGGDPFVFGRGGEEALALQEAQVPFEVVPGITSAIAVPAYAGVPVTHRGLSTSFTVVTGHSRHAVDRETNWEALATAGGTIVVLMGVAHRGAIAARLTMVFGAVAGLALEWYEQRPLFGCQVVVTRARLQASGLVTRLRDLGARPVEVPAIRIDRPADGGAELDRAAAALAAGRYDWVVFSSANAVEALLARLPDARSFGSARIAAMGPGTAAALAGWRLVADLVPERSVAEGLLEAFPDPEGPGASVLLPRAGEGRLTLQERFVAAGWEVDAVEAYRTARLSLTEAEQAAIAGADAVCFASASSVHSLVDAAGGLGSLPPVVVCIGPTTAAAAEAAGLDVTAVAARHTLEGLVDALVVALNAGKPAGGR